MLKIQAVQPFGLCGAQHPAPRALRQLEVVGRVAVADAIPLPAPLKTLVRVGADYLEHPEPRLVGPRLAGDKATVHQPGVQLEGVALVQFGDRRGVVEPPAAGEHGQPAEQRPLGRLKQVVAPGNSLADGLLSLREVPGAPAEEDQRPVQPGQDRGRGKDAGPRSGELDR